MLRFLRPELYLAYNVHLTSVAFDFFGIIYEACLVSSLSRFAFLQAGAGEPDSPGALAAKRPGTGRTVAGNRGQGHFQDQARQLTSPAIGRAIL